MGRTAIRVLICLLAIGVWGAYANVVISNTLDLTTANASGTGTGAFGGGFYVQQIEPRSTGSGVINSFLRVNGNNHPNEAGYNVAQGSANGVLDDVAGGFTTALLLSAVPTITIGSVAYREFILDINQMASSALLSLNQIEIFAGSSSAPTTSGGAPCASATPTCTVVPYVTLSGENLVFAMNNFSGGTTETYQILLNYNLNTGSGSGDMLLYVRDSAFATYTPATTYVTLFSQFGSPTGGSAQNDGYEEWAVCQGGCLSIPSTPDGGTTALLLGLVLGAGGLVSRLKK